MEKDISIIHQKYPALKIAKPGNGHFQRMFIALSEDTANKIEIKKKDPEETYETCYKFIYDILNETNSCDGYFFEWNPRMNNRYLHLEYCLGNLESYIHEETLRDDFKWTVLQVLCCQLVESIDWLHNRNIFHDGNLNPRNILVKVSDYDKTKLKLFVPDSLNPFNTLDIVYTKCWSITSEEKSTRKDIDQNQQEEKPLKQNPEKSIRRDISSVAILVYFIQSAGAHPFELVPEHRNNFDAITKNIKGNVWDVKALSTSCFCKQGLPCTETIACKYRAWVNSLAQDWTKNVLEETEDPNTQSSFTNKSSSELIEHPFFWNTASILPFIEKSFNYLYEANDEAKQRNFGWTKHQSKNIIPRKKNRTSAPAIKQPWDIGDVCSNLSIDYENIIKFLHEYARINKDGEKDLIPKIENYYVLLQQIRNKSCHWHEQSTQASKDARTDLGQMIFLTSNDHQMEVYPTKYCLFWMVHFPSLLLYTWKELKDCVTL